MLRSMLHELYVDTQNAINRLIESTFSCLFTFTIENHRIRGGGALKPEQTSATKYGMLEIWSKWNKPLIGKPICSIQLYAFV